MLITVKMKQHGVETCAANILLSICQFLRAQNLINILDWIIIVLIDHIHGNHWRFVLLFNMHLLSNANSNTDELCGYLYYDLFISQSLTVKHGDWIGTIVNRNYFQTPFA